MALSLDPLTSILFAFGLVLVFIIVGFIQIIWLRSSLYQATCWPLDCGKKVFGNPIFGKNKTLGGIIVLGPLVTLGTLLLGFAMQKFGYFPILDHTGNNISASLWLQLGLIISLGYIAGELLNSFVKRQLGIMSGETSNTKIGSTIQIIIDQVDSVLSSLFCFYCFVTIHLMFAITIFVMGAIVHQLFNILLCKLGMKSEAR